jgi:hypothetical protein
VKTRKTILPAILLAILCASIGLTATPPVKADDPPPTLTGPWLIRWKALLDPPDIPMSVLDVEADKLTVDVPYNFMINLYLPQYYESYPYYVGVRFYLNYEGSGDMRVYDVERDGDYLVADGTLTFTSITTYHVSAKVVYYNTQTQAVYQIWTGFTPIEVITHEKPMMSDEEGDGPLDGPWDINFQPVSPNNLVKNTQYFFHVHLYHLAYSEDDLDWGVYYQYDWGDGSPWTLIDVPLDGENDPPVDEKGSHTWTSTGTKTVRARAGWYLKSYPQVCYWSDWDSISVTVGDPIQLTVLARNQYGQTGLVPLYIDGVYVGLTEQTYTVSSGSHQIYVQSPIYGGYHVFYFYYYDGNYNYNNPMTLSITSSKTITAYYYSA